MGEGLTAIYVDLVLSTEAPHRQGGYANAHRSVPERFMRGNPQSLQRPHDGSAHGLATLRKLPAATREQRQHGVSALVLDRSETAAWVRIAIRPVGTGGVRPCDTGVDVGAKNSCAGEVRPREIHS